MGDTNAATQCVRCPPGCCAGCLAIILCCTLLLYSVVLCCTLLYSVVLCCTLLNSVFLNYTLLYSAVVNCTLPYNALALCLVLQITHPSIVQLLIRPTINTIGQVHALLHSLIRRLHISTYVIHIYT